jgi:DNA-binding NarL/FixJ family response regulator
MIKVLVCEDQTLVRQGLVTILSMESGISIVGEAVDGYEALEKVGNLSPDVVLMDVRMPLMDGVEATRAISTKYPNVRVIILTTYDYEEYVLEGVKAGAVAYVLKDTAAPDLVRTIQRVHRGERFIQPAVANKILFELAKAPEREPDAGIEPLSEREIDIISRLAQGMSNREVAAELTLAEGTIKNYVSSILSKLRASNRVQAINLAREHKII